MNLRLAVHAPNYDCDEFVVRWLNNVGPHVEKIYLAYPERPWGYNPDSRKTLKNSADPDLIQQSSYAGKVEVVYGDWLTEEATRNECLDRAKAEGFDFLIVQDLDEFYTPEAFQKNVEGLSANRGFHSYRAPWHIFWRDVRHIIRFREVMVRPGGKLLYHQKRGTIGYMAAFALNCKTEVRFASKRMPTHLDSVCLLDGICCHLSLVLSDEAMRLKLKTWGHASQVKERWYRYKWQGWRPGSRNIYHLDPPLYLKAEPYLEKLPAEIEDFSPGMQNLRSLSAVERIGEFIYDIRYILPYYFRLLRTKAAHTIRSR